MTPLEIASLREMFPTHELYYVTVKDDEFIFRVITPAEYMTVKGLASNEYDEQDLITQTALVYPANYNVLYGFAGIPKVLSKLILQFSMIGEEASEVRAHRGQAYIEEMKVNVEEQIPVLIKMAFPEFTFEQIEQWNLDTILKRFAQALWALDKRGLDVSQYEVTYTPPEVKTFKQREAELLEAGIDPVLALYNEYKPVVDIVDFPFITGGHWNNEEIGYAVQQQLHKSRQR